MLSVYLTEEGQALGKAMVEASKEWEGVSAPRIDKSSDSAKKKAIKNIISQMLQFEPANRITAAQVVDRLLELKGEKVEVEKPSVAQEKLKGNLTEVQKPKSRMPKWWPGSKK